MRLPLRKNIQPSAGVDHDPLPYYYMPLIGSFYKKRLQLALRLMGTQFYPSLLEIGYGSGIFLPELSMHCNKLAAIDLHENMDLVKTFLKKEEVKADLFRVDLNKMPFEDSSFDCIVCMSVLEHVPDLDRAISEIKRVLKKGAMAIIGFPTRGLISSICMRLQGFDPVKQHPNDEKILLNKFKTIFPPEITIQYPSFLPAGYAMYIVLKCIKNTE